MTLWVIKIGTSLLRGSNEKTTANIIDKYCSCIAKCKNKGDLVILVSSGAVGLGCLKLGIKERPEDLSSLQASAAIGQGHLMALYEAAMNRYGFNIAQILLTRADLGSKKSYHNAALTLKKLLEWGVVPIVNENDTISAEELRYGDNDTLSALVATAVSANQLILLTDVDKLYSADPRIDANALPITEVHHPNQLKSLEKESTLNNNWGTGGIKTKLSAARIATASGITVHLADGRNPEMLENLLKGHRGGTVFHPHPKPITSRKNWLAHAIEPIGNIYLDEGACDAIQNRGASLLLVGVAKIEGSFSVNQPVKIINTQNIEIARGISSLSSEFIQKALALSNRSSRSPIVIHRDVLVLTSDLFS